MASYERPTLRVDGGLATHTLATSPGPNADLTISTALGSAVARGASLLPELPPEVNVTVSPTNGVGVSIS